MKVKLLAPLGLLALALALLALACQGDGEPTVRVQKGLGVAALAPAGAPQQGAQPTGAQRGGAPATGDIGFGGSGLAVPSFAQKGGGIKFAPFPFPAFQQGQEGITVQGFGSATVPADSAKLELFFGSNIIIPLPQGEPGRDTGVEPAPPVPAGQAAPITEADLQPVVDAIVAQGVPRADVEVIVGPQYDPYSSSATIRVTVRNLDAIQSIVDAATSAAGSLSNIALQSTSVIFTVSDCPSLERQAMQAAVEDAKERGGIFAQALGVGLGPVVGASHYTYSPFGPSPCDPSFGGPYPLGGFPYVQGQPSEVQLVANVTITYAIQ